ncbi:MAG: hypothetical protein ABSC56_06775 [Solirubrobacteraceae bacterium]
MRARALARYPRPRLALALCVLACLSATSAALPALASASTPLTFASSRSVFGGYGQFGVSCPSTSLCVAAGGLGYLYVSTDPASATSSWTQVSITGGNSWAGVNVPISCPTSSFCVAVNKTTGDAYVSTDPATLSPSAWAAHSVGASAGTIEGVSCASTTICVVATYGGGAYISTSGGTSWSAVTALATKYLGSVSCPASSFCVLTGYSTSPNGHTTYTLTNLANGASASEVSDTGADAAEDLEAVSCASSALCVAVDGGGYAVSSANPLGASWNTPTQTSADPLELAAVSCPLASMCVAVGSGGQAVFSTTPTGPSADWPLDSGFDGTNPLDGVSCPQSGLCVAVDGNGYEALATGATLAVSLAGTGSGAVTDSDSYINCGSTCSADYAGGSPVTLTATPSAGSVLAGWSGGGCSGTATTCTVTNGAAGSSQTVTATFSPPPPTPAPLTPVAVAPPGTTLADAAIRQKQHSAVFMFTATGSATSFQCALVRKPQATRKHKHPKTPVPSYGTCSAPKTYRHLKPGQYIFYVEAVGPGGISPVPATRSFKIG